MARDKLEALFVRAAEIAKNVPESMQEAAFNRALDALLEEQTGEPGIPRRKRSREKREGTKPPREADTTNRLQNIDRTKHSDVARLKRAADRALRVLQIAHDELEIDGLTAIQISEVLTTKFRVSTKPAAVRMALQRETDTVDVRKNPDGSQVFHLMAAGDAYLKKLKTTNSKTADASSKKTTSKRGGTRKRPRKQRAAGAKTSGSSKKAKTAGKPTGTRPGPKKALSALAESGFFDSPRTISDIPPELRDKKGHTYSLQELSPALVRLVRSGVLTRERNDAGQYEYSRA